MDNNKLFTIIFTRDYISTQDKYIIHKIKIEGKTTIYDILTSCFHDVNGEVFCLKDILLPDRFNWYIYISDLDLKIATIDKEGYVFLEIENKKICDLVKTGTSLEVFIKDKIKLEELQIYQYSNIKNDSTEDGLKTNYNLGKKYFEEKNFELSETYLEKATQEKNYDAYYLLSLIKIINNNFKEAEEYLKIAAQENHIKAQVNLGQMYFWGNILERNKILGMKLLKKASEKEDEDAYNTLGIIENDKGNFEKANQYFEIAAKKGNPLAQCSLAKNYFLGKGTDKNISQARFWFEKASESGYKPAIEILKIKSEVKKLNTRYIKKLSFIEKFALDSYDFVCFCPEINEYMLVLNITWVSYYLRYYWISKEDYELAKTDINSFKKKYKDAFNSVDELPKGITFMGAEALRDYEGMKNFQRYISTGVDNVDNVFQHFLYADKILYAHILMDGVHYAALPYRIIKNKNDEYVRPLENNENVEMFYGNLDGEKIPLFMGIRVDKFEGFEEWENDLKKTQ